ncbi:MAG: hypothetical protein IPK97_11870 [Ahniella sp.]|nr:hypothetical protein [Ahniella sp.]
MFRPSYLILDEDRKILSSQVDVPLCYAQGWGRRETGYFGLIKLEPQEHSGLLIHSSSTSKGTSISFANSASTALTTVSVSYDFPASPIGTLEVPLDEKLGSHLKRKCGWLFTAEPTGSTN